MDLLDHLLMLFDEDGLLYDGPIPHQARVSALKFLIEENEGRTKAREGKA